MSKEIEVLEFEATRIKYQDKIWIPEEGSGKQQKEKPTVSSEKIRCWIRLKDLDEFKLDDLREAFPEWVRYAKSQLVFKINPLVKDKTVLQLTDDTFKVSKS